MNAFETRHGTVQPVSLMADNEGQLTLVLLLMEE